MNPNDTRLKYVRVTNGLPFAFTDRYDGVPVTIPAGKSENIPIDMAAHFFGPSFETVPMLRHVAKRQGWNTPEYALANPETGRSKAEDLFAKLTIEPVSYKLVEEKPDPKAPVPAEQDFIEDDDGALVRRGPGRPKKTAEVQA